ncbi:MAG: bacterial transcriptional activator domain-containing protein [Anaerolineae bacterium]|nr:bacterial transcriptional activator domain-containing protein [Anaerolineae bacterium]MDW8172047.1 bacterial transcriptional activator domain-containing protein [Anaerolineae bacterium]
MMTTYLVPANAQELQERIQGKRLILFYPTIRCRNLILAQLMSLFGDRLIYHRARGDDLSTLAWAEALLSEIAPTVGLNWQDAEDTSEIGELLAEALNQHDTQPIMLYLDEVERVRDEADFHAFIHALLRGLAEHVQLLISARTLHRKPWISYLQAREAVVLSTEARSTALTFTTEPQERPQVDVYGFGRGRVFVNGHEITTWDGLLPRYIFFFLMDNELVTRDQIFATFWPDLPVKEATNVFHVTKRKISERISTAASDGQNYEFTTYCGGFYMPSDKVCRHYDVADFEKLMEHGYYCDSDDERLDLFLKAVGLYRAPFLETINMPWVIQHREKLRMMFVDALVSIGRIMRARNQSQPAVGYFQRALREVPQREDIHREVMELYVLLNRDQDAVRQYRFLERHLQQTMGLMPSKETRQLFDRIK